MEEVQGMDLRDWFAVQALNGILSSPHCLPIQSTETPKVYAARLAQQAYEFAEAMTRERLKRHGNGATEAPTLVPSGMEVEFLHDLPELPARHDVPGTLPAGDYAKRQRDRHWKVEPQDNEQPPEEGTAGQG